MITSATSVWSIYWLLFPFFFKTNLIYFWVFICSWNDFCKDHSLPCSGFLRMGIFSKNNLLWFPRVLLSGELVIHVWCLRGVPVWACSNRLHAVTSVTLHSSCSLGEQCYTWVISREMKHYWCFLQFTLEMLSKTIWILPYLQC